MASVELNATYVLTGPDGTRAVFNNQADPDFVGMITELTGFDSAEVRESADDLVQMDGGIHGDFFYSRRPITMSGLVLNPSSIGDRNDRLERISRATNAMRADAVLEWTPESLATPIPRQLRLRRQQPLRISGAWQKTFQAAMVAADPRIYSTALHSSSVAATTPAGASGRAYPKTYPFSYGPSIPNGQLIVSNAGDADSWPFITITGPASNPTILNLTTGGAVYITYTLSDGEWLEIDTLNRTIMLNGSASRYGSLDFTLTEWFPLAPGSNDLRLAFTSFSSPASMTVQYRDAWL